MIDNTCRVIQIILIFFSLAEGYDMKPALRGNTERTIDLLINCQFTYAIQQADSLARCDSLEPLYPLLKLCALGLRNLDFDILADTSQFVSAYKTTCKVLEWHEASKGISSYSKTIRGYADAAYASYHLLNKRYYSALKSGLRAVTTLKEVREQDSSAADADFILGLYVYSKAELQKKLLVIPFVYPKTKKEGIASLEHSRRLGILSSRIATLVLADIYRQEKQFTLSNDLLFSMKVSFPGSRFILWQEAKYHESTEHYADAATVYGKLAMDYDTIAFGEYNSLNTRLRQIELLEKAGSRDSASMLARHVVDTHKSGSESSKERYRSLLRKIGNHR